MAEFDIPVGISGINLGESLDSLLLSGTVVGKNPNHVCWDRLLLRNASLNY